jgi:hypothetical protein
LSSFLIVSLSFIKSFETIVSIKEIEEYNDKTTSSLFYKQDIISFWTIGIIAIDYYLSLRKVALQENLKAEEKEWMLLLLEIYIAKKEGNK